MGGAAVHDSVGKRGAAYVASILACLPLLRRVSPTFAAIDPCTSTLPMFVELRQHYAILCASRDATAKMY